MRAPSLFIAALLLPLVILAQPSSTAPATCAVPDHLPPAQLAGLWTLTLWPDGGTEAQAVSRGALLLERHPDFPASVRGDLKRSTPGNDAVAVVSGDVTEGEFHLDESADGKTMSAVWSGTAQDCNGRLDIRGSRRPAEGSAAAGEAPLRFKLERTTGWR